MNVNHEENKSEFEEIFPFPPKESQARKTKFEEVFSLNTGTSIGSNLTLKESLCIFSFGVILGTGRTIPFLNSLFLGLLA
jgi:hypothetical protein